MLIVRYKKMKLIQEYKGHLVKAGSTAGQYANPYKLWDDGKNYVIEMFDRNNKSFFFDYSDLKTVLLLKTDSGNRVSWYVQKTGTTQDKKRDLYYICCRNGKTHLYLHAYLMDHIGNGKGQNSVDHIDRNPLNNRRSNLRIATQTVQNQNTVKRSRKKTARPLPDGIVQDDIPKYVVYYVEKQKNKLGYRDFFKIEKHPNQTKYWGSSKSMKLTPKQKLDQAITQLKIFDAMGIKK